MIELKNVTKIYKSKKGNSTKALNNVNLKFENKGMVFIVGKSGSGKSTLLNLLGGLDSATSGEILVNNQNINEFSASNYDAYRNTYIGFIFQEFNVLEQYNVYENIELSLKLQGKNSSKLEIEDILKKLGLENLENRRINELSGGQKQRVAIARAIIKNPKIILADEPTGNLDKNSSEQIFNILKDISKDHLVIVVSHDNEAANIYADRIIKIEDGCVLTDPIDCNMELEELKLKRAKLPFSYALKMAFNSFKSKPIKLLMTIILTTISFIFMFFTVNCSLFNKEQLIINTMRDNNDYIYYVKNSYYGYMGSITNKVLNQTDLDYISSVTNSKLNLVYNLYDNGNMLNFEFGLKNNNLKRFQHDIYGLKFIEVVDDNILKNIIGRMPSEKYEIVIHKYLADYMIEYGVIDINGNLYFPNSYEDLVSQNKLLKMGSNSVMVVGIIDDDTTLFKNIIENDKFESDELENYYFYKYVSKASNIYVKGFTKNVILENNKNSILDNLYITNKKETEFSKTIHNYIESLDSNINIITSDGIKNINYLKKDEAILSLDALKQFYPDFDTNFMNYFSINKNKSYDESLESFISNFLSENLVNLSLKFNDVDGSNFQNDIKIIGISLDQNNYISNIYVEEYKPIDKIIYSVMIYDDNLNNLKKSFNNLLFNDTFELDENLYGDYYNYSLDISNLNEISNIIGVYKYLTIYILIVSLVFMLFAFLLFSNFIAVSISYFKKEIGILRAIGATSADITKIFLIESIIIALISFVLSVFGFYFVCDILNNSLFKDLFILINGFVINPYTIILLFIYVIIISVLVTTSLIGRISKIKPIDVILNK